MNTFHYADFESVCPYCEVKAIHLHNDPKLFGEDLVCLYWQCSACEEEWCQNFHAVPDNDSQA